MNDYIKQAKDFLDDTGTKLTMFRYPENVAPKANWGNSGYCYRVTLERENKPKYSFNFWDSKHNMLAHKKPTAYDILACLDTYVDTDMSIDDFASEYGYTGEILKTIDTYNNCIEQTRKLKELFTTEQLEQLAEIS